MLAETNPEAHIKLPVAYFEHPDLQPYLKSIFFNYYWSKTICIPDEHYAIHSKSVPSVDELIRVHSILRQSTSTKYGPFSGLIGAIDQFVKYYCCMHVNLPLVSQKQSQNVLCALT